MESLQGHFDQLDQICDQIENIGKNNLSPQDAALLLEMESIISWLEGFNTLFEGLVKMKKVQDKSQRFIQKAQKLMHHQNIIQDQLNKQKCSSFNEKSTLNRKSLQSIRSRQSVQSRDFGRSKKDEEEASVQDEKDEQSDNQGEDEVDQSNLWFVPLNDNKCPKVNNLKDTLASQQPSLLQRLQERRNYIRQRRNQRINSSFQSSEASKVNPSRTKMNDVRSSSAFPWLSNYIPEKNRIEKSNSRKGDLPSNSTSPYYTDCNCDCCCRCDGCHSTRCNSCCSQCNININNNINSNRLTHIFTHNQMRRQTERMYGNLPEVRDKQNRAKIEQTKRTAQILRQIYTARVKEQTLRGKTDFPITQNFL